MTTRITSDGTNPLSSPVRPLSSAAEQSPLDAPGGRINEQIARANEERRRLTEELRQYREENIKLRDEQRALREELIAAKQERAIIKDSRSLARMADDSGTTAGNIIGRSAVLRDLLKQIKIVAPTNATVLILGETGSGKELVARAIHALSSRRDRAFAKINCAAIPSGLLESELFGYERGAFTGASARKVGRFELAHQGTLFLDEIADFPPELQPKLLRVLQEKEFERLGGTHTQRVNLRLVAATSRDLSHMVAERQFRNDLYYRLNVFPIRVPPLRERLDDIPLLVRHFVKKYAEVMGKEVEIIPPELMDALRKHSWPGNVRELENFVERAVILSSGNILNPPLIEFAQPPRRNPLPVPANNSPAATTLEDCERNHILQALNDCRWVVGGPNGAALRLGLKRTTLIWKMRKLGISRKTPPLAETPGGQISAG